MKIKVSDETINKIIYSLNDFCVENFCMLGLPIYEKENMESMRNTIKEILEKE